MASPISRSPRLRRPVSPRPPPRYKFTIFPPDIYAPVTLSYSPSHDSSYGFCKFLKGKFESHFGMRCYLPSQPGTAYIGDFDEFEQRFLIDAEYIVVVVTEKSVLALKKFYPRLLVFVTVRPEWVNRFILVFVGDVALDPSVDLSVLFHQPIIFKQTNWEADVETWKALHVLLKVEWTPHKEEEPRRAEVVSIIERTVVETEVQEVRTRRRTSSRSSDGTSTPGSASPLPASRRVPEGPDLHLVSPAAERPVVETMPGGRRAFGARVNVESSRPVVLNAPGAGEHATDRTTAMVRPRVVIERSPEVEKSLQSAQARKPVRIEREYERQSEEKEKEPEGGVGAERPAQEKEPSKSARSYTVQSDPDKEKEKGASEDEIFLLSERRVPEASRGDAMSTASQPSKEASQESRETSGYSSLDSSISTRSLGGAVQSPPVALRLSTVGPEEEEASSPPSRPATDHSFVTAKEAISASVRTGAAAVATDGRTSRVSDTSLTARTDDVTLDSMGSVDAYQLTPGTSEDDSSHGGLRQAVAAMAGTTSRPDPAVVERVFEEDGRTVNIKVCSEQSTHPRTGQAVTSKAIEVDVEGDDAEDDSDFFFYSTEHDPFFATPPADSVKSEPSPRRRGHSGSSSRPLSSSSITISSDVEAAPEADARPGRFRTSMTLAKSQGDELRERSASMSSLAAHVGPPTAALSTLSLSSPPRPARSVENLPRRCAEPETVVITTQSRAVDAQEERRRGEEVAPLSDISEDSSSVSATRAAVGSELRLLAHAVGVAEVTARREEAAVVVHEERFTTSLEVAAPAVHEARNGWARVSGEKVTSRLEVVSPEPGRCREAEEEVTRTRSQPSQAAPLARPQSLGIAVKEEWEISHAQILAKEEEKVEIPPAQELDVAVGDNRFLFTASTSDVDGGKADEVAAHSRDGGTRHARPQSLAEEELEAATVAAAERLIPAAEEAGLFIVSPSEAVAMKVDGVEVAAMAPSESVEAAVEGKVSDIPSLASTPLQAQISAVPPATAIPEVTEARTFGVGSSQPSVDVGEVQASIIPSSERLIPVAEEASLRISSPSEAVAVKMDGVEVAAMAPSESMEAAVEGKVSGIPSLASTPGAAEISAVPPATSRAKVGEARLFGVGASEAAGKAGKLEEWERSPSQELEVTVEENVEVSPGQVSMTEGGGSRVKEAGRPPLDACTLDTKGDVFFCVSPSELSPPREAARIGVGPTPTASPKKSAPVTNGERHAPASTSQKQAQQPVPITVGKSISSSVTPMDTFTPVSVASAASPVPAPAIEVAQSARAVRSGGSEASVLRLDSREHCLLDDLSYASLTSEEDVLRIYGPVLQDSPVFEEEEEEKRAKRRWMLPSLGFDALRLPQTLKSASAGLLAKTWLVASGVGTAVGRLVWAPVPDEGLKKPLNVTLLLATATALSPVYRQFSLSLFELLTAFLWPPVVGVAEEVVVAGATLVSLPMAELAPDASAPVTDVLPTSTLSIINPGQLPRLSPTEVLRPTRFVFWVASPPR